MRVLPNSLSNSQPRLPNSLYHSQQTLSCSNLHHHTRTKAVDPLLCRSYQSLNATSYDLSNPYFAGNNSTLASSPFQSSSLQSQSLASLQGSSNLAACRSNDSLNGSVCSNCSESESAPEKALTREVCVNQSSSSKPKEEDPAFGLRVKWVRSRLHVAKVERKSRAEECGIGVGDEIVEINDIVIDQGYSEEAIESLLDNGVGTKLIVRDGEGQYVTIEKSKLLPFGVRGGKITGIDGQPISDQLSSLNIIALNGKPVVGKSDGYLRKTLKKTLKKKPVSLALLEGEFFEELSRPVD